MMRYRRQGENLGLCTKPLCLERYKSSMQGHQYEVTPMVLPRPNTHPAKCFRCNTAAQPNQEGYYCSLCGDNYCDPCLGYNLFYDLQELEDLLK
mmetsp:Transcript_16536/g.28103  ORF Transcript_16536/g.28103 Transcript_16536/m.28103 type:complete len:94 (+) Transcript_16536:964-1245(+)